MVGAVQGMQGSELPPTKAQLDACAQQETAYASLMARWAGVKAKASGTAPAPARGGAANNQ